MSREQVVDMLDASSKLGNANNTYLVTIEACHASFRSLCRIPISLLVAYERPNNAPGKDGAKQDREVDKVRADHAGSNIREAEVKEKPAEKKDTKKLNP
jgi:hypothetical protein